MINLRFYQIKEILLQTSLFASKKTPKWWSYFTSLRTIPETEKRMSSDDKFDCRSRIRFLC